MTAADTGPKYGGKRHHGCPDCGRAVLDFTEDADYRCTSCRLALGLPAKAMPPQPPWYSLMSVDELAAIRAKPWSGGRTSWLVDASTVPASGLCIVLIEYQCVQGGTKTLMAGKVVTNAHIGCFFFHAFKARQQRNQGHRVSGCPCPVDTVLADWLTAQEITWFYAFDRDAGRLWKITVEAITDAPVMEYDKITVRQRFFPEAVYWESIGNLVEKPSATSRGHIFVPDRGTDRKPVLRVPFVAEVDTITLRNVPKL